jgi:hypothetical protein
MYKLTLLLFSVLSIFVVTLSVKASNLGATLELECPCTFSTDSITSSVIKAGITNGAAAPGGEVTFNIAADSAMTLTAQDIENGNSDLITGSLGDGGGKWRLVITSDIDLQVQSLLDTPTGFLTNLSRFLSNVT